MIERGSWLTQTLNLESKNKFSIILSSFSAPKLQKNPIREQSFRPLQLRQMTSELKVTGDKDDASSKRAQKNTILSNLLLRCGVCGQQGSQTRRANSQSLYHKRK